MQAGTPAGMKGAQTLHHKGVSLGNNFDVGHNDSQNEHNQHDNQYQKKTPGYDD